MTKFKVKLVYADGKAIVLPPIVEGDKEKLLEELKNESICTAFGLPVFLNHLSEDEKMELIPVEEN
tara:strand:- start:689 stop:886 length:198 start_codon:yes stop_codon:yes gene_type:complete